MMAKKHDDEAQDKKLISKMIKQAEKKEPKGMKKGGVTGKSMRAVGRNLARAQNQKPGSK
jgi:hypothetical protein